MKSQLTLTLFLLIFWQIGFGQSDSIQTHKKTDLNQIHFYIDSVAEAEMESAKIPGAVVVVIQDSSEVYIKPYGFADIENQIPVDAEKTGFRIASVTKTFTATAMMQLVEQGKIDLHTSIDQYLPDENFSFLKYEPMTVHQLLTHTAGIDLTDIGDAALKPEAVVPLEDFVRSHIPAQVNPPGKVHSYSNFGYTLLGYLIQAVSGMRYEDYITQNILHPLGMYGSSMEQPLPSPFLENRSKSYVWDKDHKSIPRDFTNTTPGGGLISTGTDMANYMLMHLNNAILDSSQILSPESHKTLISQQYGSKDTKYGVCYAFFENGWTGRRNIEHSGAQLGFLSLMILIPETGTGLFIAQNTRENAGSFRYNLAGSILDTLLHRKERHIDLPKANDELNEMAANYVGRYQQMNYPHSSFERLGTLFGFYNSAYVVRYNGNGMLQLNGDDYVMIDENVFHRNDSTSAWNVEFELDEQGVAQRIIAGTTSYGRAAWYESKKLWQRAIVFSFALIVLFIIGRPIYSLVKKHSKKPASTLRSNKAIKWIYYTGLLFLLGVIGIILNMAIHQGQLADYGVPFSLKVPLFLNTLGAISTLFAPFGLILLWRSKEMNLGSKLFYTLLVIALIILTLGFWYHNVVGFHY